jgi:hypothetical protein
MQPRCASPAAHRAVARRPVHATFAVGRLAKDDWRVVILQRLATAPIPGPWELRAVVARS